MRARTLPGSPVAGAMVAALAATMVAALAAATVAAGVVVPSSSLAAPPTDEVVISNGCLESVPDPGTTEPVQICYTLFQPPVAGTVPLVMHSHGWGGSRSRTAGAFTSLLESGYGVLSFDQRGFGESGGTAHVQNPDVEGHDVQALVDLVADLHWVRKDGPGDPRLGAIGGSYGGGYQYLGAFQNLATRGEPVFDALAPEITWHDLTESLAPEGVVRTEWGAGLYATGAQSLPPEIAVALAEAVATGRWPDGTVPGTPNLVEFFRKNGPKWHVEQGRRLDIPVLMGQGATDTLFNLEQGLANWHEALTEEAKAESIFVAYNGGHILPSVFPQGSVSANSDPCSVALNGGSFRDLAVRFFDEKLKHQRTGLTGYGQFHLATAGGACTTVDSVEAGAEFPIGTVATTEAAGAPLSVEVAKGPIRVAGTPYLTGSMLALGANNRAFYGLAVGTSPTDAKLVQNNVLPVNELEPVLNEQRTVALPSVAVDVPAGQNLYLLATPFSDVFAGMGSRTPGAIALQDTVVHLPVVDN